jgi:hypothetical protein
VCRVGVGEAHGREAGIVRGGVGEDFGDEAADLRFLEYREDGGEGGAEAQREECQRALRDAEVVRAGEDEGDGTEG